MAARGILLIVGLWCGLPFASAQAQQQPEPAPPAASEAAPLPALEVTAKKETKKKSVQKKPATSKPAVAKKAPAQQPEPETPKPADVGSGPGTGTGPIEGYVATKTTTGAKSDTPLNEIPQSISVVGQEQIRDQGAKNWQETLRYLPGVIADGYGIDSRADTAFVRGTEAAEFLDGLKRTFNYYTYTYRIDPYFMERIEVLRGPPSVLYGQAPVGGIVNSVSKRPQETARREVTVEYGTNDYKQIKADLTGPLTQDGRWSYRLIGALRDADTQVDYVPDDHMALSPSLTFKPQAGTSITLLGHFQNDDSGSTQQFLPHVGTRFRSASGYVDSDLFVGEPGFDRYDTDVKSGSLFVDHKFNDTFAVHHNMRYSDIFNVYDTYYPGFFAGPETVDPNFPFIDPAQRTIRRIKAIGDTSTQLLNTDTNLEAKLQTGPASHRLLGGLDYAKFQSSSTYGQAVSQTPFDLYNPVYGQPDNLGIPNYDPNTGLIDSYRPVGAVPLTDFGRQDITQTGLYLQDQIKLANWIAVLGVRRDWLHQDSSTLFLNDETDPADDTVDANDQRDEATTYRAGLMYQFPSGLTPYLSYAQSFVPLIGRKSGGGTFTPQEGEMYEAGFKYQAPGLPFIINSAVYDITENSRLASDPNDPNFSIQTGAVSIKGFEFEATGNLTRNLKTIVSYSYTDAIYTGGDQDGFRVESVPHHLASLWAIYSFDTAMLKGWSIGGGIRYIGTSLDGADEIKTPAVGLVDAALAYDTKDWRWSLNASNLEDKEYLSTCLSRGDCFVGARRTIMTGLTYKF